MILRSRSLLLTLALCTAVPCVITATPAWSETKSAIEKNLDASKNKEKVIADDLSKTKKTLSELRKDMVKKTADVRRHENKLLDIDTRLKNLKDNIQTRQQRLEKDKESMGTLLLALQRIARVPPEALIARPDTPINTARSSLLVKTAIPTLKKEAEELAKTLQELEILHADLTEEMGNRVNALETLKTEQASLEGMLKKRERFYNTLLGDKEKQAAETTRLRLKAKDLASLMSAVKKQSQQNKKKEEDKGFSFFDLFDSDGDYVMPVTGRIKTHFGDEDEHGLKSKGITIQSTSGTTVVSPMAGRIRFAGPFKNYKLIVIIEHDDGYHSLIAGLSEIYGRVGSEIFSGEPVGKISSSDKKQTSLYFELRHNGSPTNPEKKIRKG